MAMLWIRKGLWFYDQNRYDDALSSFEQALAIDPTNTAAQVWKINTLFT